MFAPPRIEKGRIRTGLTVAFAMAAWASTAGLGLAQAPKPGPEKPHEKPAESRRIDAALDQKINQAREEIELLELQVETRKAQHRLADARLTEARYWKDRTEKLFRDGFAGEERYIAARDDVLMHESRVAWEQAGVREAELRLKQARRRLDYGEFPIVPQEGRVIDLEQRITALEKSNDLLQQEVGNLRRMIRLQWKMPDNVERPAMPGSREIRP